MFRGHRLRWLFVSGVLAGCAMSLKQSGFDGFVAVMVCLVVGGLTRERRWRDVLRECAVCIAGWAAVMAVLLLHGIVVGFSAWWYALAGYRVGGLNATDADWHRFGITSRLAAPTILPLAAVAVIGVDRLAPVPAAHHPKDGADTRVDVLRSRRLPAGGLFHRHYWVTLTFPFAAAAAVAIGRINGHVAIAVAVASLAVIPSLISTERGDRAATAPTIAITAHDDPRLTVDEQLLGGTPTTAPRDRRCTRCVPARRVYADADAIPPYPYLWLDGVQHGRGAQAQLVQLFAGDNPPTFVARYQAAAGVQPVWRGRTAAEHPLHAGRRHRRRDHLQAPRSVPRTAQSPSRSPFPTLS